MAGTAEKPIVYPPLEMPAGIERNKTSIQCLGISLDADVYRPRHLAAGNRLPGVVLSHGIGGDKLTCERYAARFAAAGMIAVTFSQAGWGASQGRVRLLDDTATSPDSASPDGISTRVQIAHNMVDPLEWIDCYLSALDYLCGEPNIDVSRIGAWGTSYGGGTALCVAAMDDRIKALAIQVPAVFNPPPEMLSLGRDRAIDIARGVIAPFPMGLDSLPGVPGTPHFARMVHYRVGDLVHDVDVPTLILDAGDEELFDTRESGERAFNILQRREIESYYEVIDGIDHYGIYFDGYERGSQLALEWFQKHL